jgi:hypothetical protein
LPRFAATGEISQSEIEAAADHWISRPNQVHRRKDFSAARTSFIIFAEHWPGHLNRLQTDQIRPCPEDSLLSQYIDHLERERGFSPLTIHLSRQRKDSIWLPNAGQEPQRKLTMTPILLY